MSATTGVQIPQGLKPVLLYLGLANAVACDVASMKNVNKAWFIVAHSGANDTDLTLTLQEATAVAAVTNQAVAAGKECPIYRDNDAGTTSDTLVSQTPALAITIDPATQNGVLAVIEWDPAKHDHADGFDCIYLADAGGDAGNYVCIIGLFDMKYQGDPTPSVIVD